MLILFESETSLTFKVILAFFANRWNSNESSLIVSILLDGDCAVFLTIDVLFVLLIRDLCTPVVVVRELHIPGVVVRELPWHT